MIEMRLDATTPKYIVRTLGRFDVVKDGNSLVLWSSGSKKLWELYKFLLTHRDHSFTPEALMDQLWVSESYRDPRSTLRRQMHRLRQLLCEDTSDDNNKTIHFTNGYYKWDNARHAEIDVDLFEKLIKQGDALRHEEPQKALTHYLSALTYYYGDYLPDCFDHHWVFSIRNHYRRLYLCTVLNTISLLKSEDRFDEIITLCQKSIQIDVYEENFHIFLMEALLHQGQRKQALVHYEYITGFYYNEMGLKPSLEMRGLYKKLLKAEANLEPNVNLFETLESDVTLENAFYCDAPVFKSIYELERRRGMRSNESFSIGAINVTPIKGYSHSQEKLRVEHLKQYLLEHLRNGDTFTLWSQTQFVVLLPEVDSNLMEKVLVRILSTFPDNKSIAINQITQLTAAPSDV